MSEAVDPSLDPDQTQTVDHVETHVPFGGDDVDLSGIYSELIGQIGQPASVVATLGTLGTLTNDSDVDADSLPATQRLATAKDLRGKYETHEEVGRGGMGRILRVVDADLNRQVAMKVLLKEGKGNHLRRFIEEAQITGQLEHPCVPPVHEFGINNEGELYFTMKYVRAHQTLRDVIDLLKAGDEDAHAEFTFERRVAVIQQVCNALHYAHLRGVIHRDIKPSNILVGDCGEVFLVDWGVAKVLRPKDEAGEGEAALDPDSGRLEVQATAEGKIETASSKGGPLTTREGAWIGTPAYMSPEQILGKHEEIDQRSDVYSLVTVLYETLTLEYYLPDEVRGDVNNLVAAVLGRKPEDAEKHVHPKNGRVPRLLSRICRKGLSKRRRDRFQSPMELARTLQAWVEGRGPVVCPGTAIQRGLAGYSRWIDAHPRAVPAVTITMVILLLGVIVGAAVILLGAG